MPLYLGLDTSNYKTSAAAFDSGTGQLFHTELPLTVKKGEGGLRQSDAVFAHVLNLPKVMEELGVMTDITKADAIGVSFAPRRAQGSYMPCFLPGVACASAVSMACGIPLYRFSHQEGHIMAAVHSAQAYDKTKGPFLALHLSGGTTELLHVKPGGNSLDVTVAGATLDINAGQLIDRVGLMLGLDFPCGAALDKIAREGRPTAVRVKAKDGFFNMSGFENKAQEMLKKGVPKEDVARFAIEAAGACVDAMLENGFDKYGPLPVIFAGGVMASEVLRTRFADIKEAAFAAPALSGDNAAGIAVLCADAHQRTAV